MNSVNKLMSKLLFSKNLKRISIELRGLSALTNPKIVKSASSDIVVPDTTVTEFVFSKIEKHSKYTALECSTTGKKYSYDRLRQLSINFGKALRKKLKLEPADVVAIVLKNSPEFAIATLGIISAGLVVTTANPIYTAEELSKQFGDCSVKAVITTGSSHKNVEKALHLSKLKAPIIIIKQQVGESIPDGAVSFEELINEKLDIPEFEARKPSDVAFLPYSSGTTGLPKGVQLTHQNLVSNMSQLTHSDFRHVIPPSDTHQDVSPLISPMFHVLGFMAGMMKQLIEGTKILTVPKFKPEIFISLIKEHPIHHLYISPPLVLFLITQPTVKSKYLKHLRFLTCGGAPLSYEDEVRFVEKFKNDDLIFGQSYGLTEASPGVFFVPIDHKLSPSNGGSVGKNLPNTLIKIKNADSEEETLLGPNETGELLIKGPQTTPGYFKRPEENKSLYLNGWLKTGDIGYYNEEGYVFITDRIKELIKVKGFQVPPAELEAVVRTCPGVEDAAVIGIPHRIQGEVPRAYVVLKKGASLKPEDIREFVSKKVTKYKHLTGGVEILDVIPRNATGKILRRELKKQFESENKQDLK